MFISVVYRETPQLTLPRQLSETTLDTVEEKVLLVNPECHVRVMLEYIRKKCKLGVFTNFDLCDERGGLRRLFDMPTYEYANDLFEHKKTYFIVVFGIGAEKGAVIPQLNHDNPMYEVLKAKVKQYILTGQLSPPVATSVNSAAKTPPPPPKKK